ncbi:alpha/beta fold hydrolase [Dokdonella sp.]|uniref:alpha/beta fold hydrolase n=1 Tax=Dokdonella sp. TaxID=2291710 RepID=UPI001B010859|nr:alpha/beta fold hydrolase [Dokdonella sp.]MBO9663801.1 alpha/beta fold hydrolase [Dokdonella sp.]
MPGNSNRDASCSAVCVHGAGGGSWEWAIWARVFAAHGHAVIAPDLQPSPRGVAATRYADYREQVVRWCRGVGAPVVLIGASLGASLALAVAEEVGARALLLINPLVPRATRGQPRAATIPWARQRSLAGTRRAMADADDAACLHAFRRWRDESGAVLDEAEAISVIASPSCPTLVLAGEFDQDIPPAISRALAIRLDADFERIAEAGHLGPLLGRVAAATAERALGWLGQRGVVPSPASCDDPAGAV